MSEAGPRRKKTRRLGAILLLAAMAAAAGWHFFVSRPERLAREELANLSSLLAPVIRTETLEPATLAQTLKSLENFKAQSPAAREMFLGGQAFLNDDPKEAAERFTAAELLSGGQAPHIHSFLAAASLRQGDSSLASAQYIKALELKDRQGAEALTKSSDQLGLSLSLFLLHQTEEARPLAEEAYQARLKALGAEAPETLTAANRLATLYLALGRNQEAEDLLKASFQAAQLGRGQTQGALEEARLLLRLLYQQTGRLDDLENFLNQPSPPAPQADAGAASRPSLELGSGQNDARPAPENPSVRPPINPENLNDWSKMARELMGHDDSLAADLLQLVLNGRELSEKISRGDPQLRPLLMDLIRACLDSGRWAQARAELGPLLKRAEAEPGSLEYLRLSGLMAEALEGDGQLREAEDIWHKIADQADARLKAAGQNGLAAQDVSFSLESHLKLADNYIRQGRTPLEAEIELKAAAKRLGKSADDFPETASVYLRLARLLWSLERCRESVDYYRQARALAEKLLKNKPGPQAENSLAGIIRAAGEESPQAAAEKPAPDFLKAAEGPKALPSPELLRRELSALSALGRADEFDGRLGPVLAEAARLHGAGSLNYMRYYSLKLKGLEEAGRIEELTRELRTQADNSPGRNEREKLLNRGSALLYAARVNQEAGRKREAGELYRQALASWKDLPDSSLGNRRQNAEEALKSLAGD